MTDRPRTKSTTVRRIAKGAPPSFEQFQAPSAALLKFIETHSSREDAKRVAKLRLGRFIVLTVATSAPFPASVRAKQAFEAGPKARAVLRGREIAIEDLERSGGTYTLPQVCELLNGISRQRVDQLVKNGKLLALPGPSNSRRYPVVQFEDDGTLIGGLKEVQAALPTKNPWGILNFLLHGDDRLQERKPIDVLRAGEVAAVVEAAKRFGEPGA